MNYVFTRHLLFCWNTIFFTLSLFHLGQKLTSHVLFLNGWEANNGFSIFKGWQTHKTTQKNDWRARKAKIFTSGPSHRKYATLDSHPWRVTQVTHGISVSAFSWYHCGPEFSTTGSSEGFNFAITGLGALRSPSWLRFTSSSCLYLSTSLLFLAVVPESQNISLVGIPEITFLLSSAASFLRTCSQGSTTFSA